MKELWNRIIHYKFNIGWVFAFLGICMALCIYTLNKLI
jgi:hypothetical protein